MKQPHETTCNWTGRTALITGASSGIGAATAKLLASKGLRVILAARRLENLEEIAEQIRNAGDEASVVVADLSSSAGCKELVRQLNQQHMLVDVLVNNAGFGWYGFYADMAWQTAEEMLQVNVHAVAHLTRLILPGMLERRYGHIVNIGSIAGGFPNQGVAVYSATKAFLDAFTTSLHREARGSGVNVCVVRPGPVKTEFFQKTRTQPRSGAIPGEVFAVSAQQVAHTVWSLLERPRRVAYVPWFMSASALIELIFSGVIDRVGPLLLRKQPKATG